MGSRRRGQRRRAKQRERDRRKSERLRRERAEAKTPEGVCRRKMQYPTAERALAAVITQALKVDPRDRRDLRVYRCNVCRLFHLATRKPGQPRIPASLKR